MTIPQLFDMVRMTTVTTGSGTVTLGSAVPPYRSFAAASVPNGALVRYAIADPGPAPTAIEYGEGVYTTLPDRLTRVLGGSSTGSLLNLSGSAHVIITAMAEDFLPYVDSRADIASLIIPQATFSTPDGAPWIHGTSAGPMAIQDGSGQWWEIDLSHGYAHASWFNAAGDGVADDAAELNAASLAMYTAGGGVVDLTGGRYLVNSADLVIRQGVSFVGPYLNFGEMGNKDYSLVKSSIVLNPAYTIRLYRFAGVKGLVVLKTGLTVPTNMRTAIDLGRSFSGTAITMGDGAGQVGGNLASDAYVGYCLIIGFNTAIYNYYNERPHVEYVSGDCTNGIYMNFVTDMDHISHCQFWPFAVAHVGSAAVAYSVTGTSGGTSGVVRIALGTNVIIAGDTIIVQAVGGTTEADGRWVVSAVGSGYIELTGSTYANAWTSGGTVYLDNTKRLGAAFAFYNTVDWGQIDNSFSYGYDIGFLVDDCNDVVLLNCGVDAYATAADPTTVGYKWQNGALRGTLIGCKGASHGYAVVQDVGAADNSNASASLNISGSHFWGNNQGHLHVVTGCVTSIGNHYDSIVGPLASTAYSITVEGGSYGGTFIGNTTSRVNPITFTAGQALYMSTVRNNRWGDASTTGNREVYDNSYRNMYFSTYGAATGLSFIGQNARGTAVAPTATQTNDDLFSWIAQSFDGTVFSNSATIRVTSDGGATAGATPGKLIFSTTAAGAATATSRIAINNTGTFYPATDNAYACGANGARWTAVWAANGTIQTSDRREKANITPSALGLAFINSLRPVSYKWKVGRNQVVDAEEDGTPITRPVPGTRTHWGLIAQEVKAVCDGAGVDFGGWVLSDAEDPDSQQALRYDQFVAPLIKAVQELSERVADLEKECK